MTEKELKRLSRKQLLELLLEQTRKVDMLEEQLVNMEKQLNNRRILASQAGNIAEAALRLNGVFEAAQAAADQYLANIRYMASRRDGGGV